MIPCPPISTRIYTLLPYTTLVRFRWGDHGARQQVVVGQVGSGCIAPGPGRGISLPLAVVLLQRRVLAGNGGTFYAGPVDGVAAIGQGRSEEQTSELQSLMRISYPVFCLKKKTSHHCQNEITH